MQKFFALWLVSLYLLAMIKPVWPVVDFYMNQDRITQEFCENKAMPELQCNGHCYLAKQLKEQADEPAPQAPPTISIWEYPIGFVNFAEIPEAYQQTLVAIQITGPEVLSGVPDGIFQPPEWTV